MDRPFSKSSLLKRQRGVAALEFALVFILAFTVFYAMVSYAFPLLMLQTFNTASAQAVRAAVKADPESDNFVETATALAQAEATRQLAVLPPLIVQRVNVTAAVVEGTRVTVHIEYPDYRTNPVIPILILPFIGEVPRVPESLVADASLSP